MKLSKKLLSVFTLVFFIASIIFIPIGTTVRVKASNPNHVLFGAIRWDGWCGDAITDADFPTDSRFKVLGLQLYRSMGPNKYHFRAPFWSTFPASNMCVNGELAQETMDKEIQYAKNAKIDYWAFFWYAPNEGHDYARELYLKSSQQSDVKFCLIIEGIRWGRDFNAFLKDQLVEYFKKSNYVKVLGDRPLLYIYNSDGSNVTDQSITDLRTACTNVGAGNPYIVDMSGTRFDASSNYTSFSSGSYANLFNADWSNWDGYRNSGRKLIPVVASGWDVRPRMDNSVWGVSYGSYCRLPAPKSLADHVQEAIDYCGTYPSVCEAQAVICYAWNEFDEGLGAICPTKYNDAECLDHIANVLGGTAQTTPMPTPGGTNLASGKTYSSSSNTTGHEASKAFDADDATYWEPTGAKDSWLEVDFGSSTTFNTVTLKGEADKAYNYKLQYYNGSSWNDAYYNFYLDTYRYCKLERAVTGSKVRLYFWDDSDYGSPKIYDMKAYNVSYAEPTPLPNPNVYNMKVACGGAMIIEEDLLNGIKYNNVDYGYSSSNFDHFHDKVTNDQGYPFGLKQYMYGSSFSYTFEPPAGTYTVNLYFAEPTYTSVGDRTFNVDINGTRKLSDYDIVSAAGGTKKGKLESFTGITPSSGKITVDFNGLNGKDALINVIEVIPTQQTGNLSVFVDDIDPYINFYGSWSVDFNIDGSNRDNNYKYTVHYTSTNNDYLEYSFKGTGVSYINDKASDLGNVDIYIDGTFDSTVSCYNASHIYGQTVYSKTGLSNSTHKIKIVKKDGTYAAIDALKIDTGSVGATPTPAPTGTPTPTATPTPTPAGGAIVIDNDDAGCTFTGTWTRYTGQGYNNSVHCKVAGDGSAYAIYTPNIASTGNYDVYARWTEWTNRATNAPYTVYYNGGNQTITENQQQNGDTWVKLGTWNFASGTSGYVKLADNANGQVIADAVEFVPAGGATSTPTPTQTPTPTSTPTPTGSAIIVDNDDAGCTFTGTWTRYTGQGYNDSVHFKETGSGSAYASFTPSITTAGNYDVYARWTEWTNRATNAPYTVYYNGGNQTITENQQQNGDTWVKLGTWNFASGTSGYVKLSDNADGQVIADAVKFVQN